MECVNRGWVPPLCCETARAREGSLEPVPETIEALDELTRYGDPDVTETLWRVTWAVERLVPEVIALSLTFVPENLTLTMTRAHGVGVSATDVVATLSLPMARRGVVLGRLDLYAGNLNAFEGRYAALAAVCDVRVGDAIRDVDLDFTTRLAATQTPDRIRAAALLDRAIGAVMAHSEMGLLEIEDRLRNAASAAGISDAQMARALLNVLGAAEG